MTEWKEEVESKGNTHNTLENFSDHFAQANRMRHRQLKLTKTAGNAGYHSANIITDLEMAADQTIL